MAQFERGPDHIQAVFTTVLAEDTAVKLNVSLVESDGAREFPVAPFQSVQPFEDDVFHHRRLFGLHNGKFDECLAEVEVGTHPGDVLCFFTDGIVETMNAQKVEFGEQRFQEALCANAHKSAQDIQTAILSELADFRGAASANDDLTLVIMKAR